MAESAKSKTEYVDVKMEDGRDVKFPTSRRMQKETLIEGNVVYVRFDFVNGVSKKYEVPNVLLLKSAGHGYEQKLGDEAAGMKNEAKTGPADIDDVIEAIDELHSRLADAKTPEDWTTVRAGTGFGGASVLLKALTEWSQQTAAPMTIDQVREFLKSKSVPEKLALRDAELANTAGITVASIVKRMEAEKKALAPKIDTASLLAGMAPA